MNNPDNRNKPVLILGDGVLSELLYTQIAPLASRAKAGSSMDLAHLAPNSGTKLVVVLEDGWDPQVQEEVDPILRKAQIPWLRGMVALGEGVVGPLVEPNSPGCARCADSRWLMAHADGEKIWGLQNRLTEKGGVKRDAWASRTGLLQMAHVLANEIHKFLNGQEGQTREHLFLLNLKTMKGRWHRFIPDPFCPVCSQVPDDSPEGAVIRLEANPKTSPDSFRVRPASKLQPVLGEQYLDPRTGVLNGKWHDIASTFATVVVNVPLVNGNEATAGRSHSYAESELTAILEGLERYCGVTARGKRTVVHDNYAHLSARLGNRCLNPLRVGVHAKEHYQRPGFPFLEFDEERAMSWVWGYSLGAQNPILVPELLAYYSLGGRAGFVYETSNGCAIGGSLVEAILHGILEVMERDAFLLTWYARLPVPRLNIEEVADLELKWMAARFEKVTGYELLLFDMTMEHGVPCIWSMARSKRRDGARLICSAGAHLNPLHAAKSAIHELAGSFPDFTERYLAHRQTSLKMLDDPFLVSEMPHHSLLYSLPEAEERLGFLLDSGPQTKPFASQFQPPARHEDLTDDLQDILHTLHQLDLDVIVVDQTPPELRRQGLYCVKTIIPGMLPMTFGYHLTRLEGLSRVLTVPMKLGYAERTLRMDELNPHPHPFP